MLKGISGFNNRMLFRRALAVKSMKLSTKPAYGIRISIIITCPPGGLAVWNMKTVRKAATIRAQENEQEVALAGNVERYSPSSVYAMRGTVQ